MKAQRWQVSNKCCTFWTLSGGNVAGNGASPTFFRIHWQANGSCSLEAFPSVEQKEESRWICARKSGQLFASTGNNASSAPACFWVRVANRRLISLRPVNFNGAVGAAGAAAAYGVGFVGLRLGEVGLRLDCNKSTPENIELVYVEQPKAVEMTKNEQNEAETEESSKVKSTALEGQTTGAFFYHLRLCVNKRFWTVGSKQLISCDAEEQDKAHKWTLEYRSGHELAIRSFDDPIGYVGMNGQGLLQLIHCDPKKAPLWDF